MKTLFLSHHELDQICTFWDLYVDERLFEDKQEEMDLVLSKVSDETRELFLDALDNFETNEIEFQVKIAFDDKNLLKESNEYSN